MNETEKTYVGQGEGDLKYIFSVSFPRRSTVYEHYIRYYGWIKIQS